MKSFSITVNSFQLPDVCRGSVYPHVFPSQNFFSSKISSFLLNFQFLDSAFFSVFFFGFLAQFFRFLALYVKQRYQTSKTELLSKIVNGFQPLTIFTKSQIFNFVLNVLLYFTVLTTCLDVPFLAPNILLKFHFRFKTNLHRVVQSIRFMPLVSFNTP